MNRKIILSLSMLFSAISARDSENKFDYLKALPADSKVRQECEACENSGFFGFLKSSKEKACKDLNQVFQNEEAGVVYQAPIYYICLRLFLGKLLDSNNYHWQHQNDLLKAAIRKILPTEADEQKWNELALCQALIKQIPQLRAERKKQEQEEKAKERQAARDRF